MKTIMECQGLAKSFHVRGREIGVLKDVSFSVRQKEIVVITGNSGQGKTVLLWLLGLMDTPTLGRIVIDGVSAGSLPAAAQARLRRERISLIFQDFNLVSTWTALENVIAALAGSGLVKREQRSRAAEMLDALGLGDRLSNLPAELSVGQRQRVAIARSMIVSPDLILADEPTGGVDRETAEEIIELLAAPVRNGTAAMVVATHGEFPVDVADKAHFLKDGVLS